MKFGGILIALAIVLSGCSGEPAPKEPQKTTSPTPKSTATPPVMPAQAKEDSDEGAAAFVAYWIQVSNYAASTGDVEELGRISDRSCAGCQAYLDLYRSTYEAGGYFRGGGWKAGTFEVETGSKTTFITTTVSLSTGSNRPTSDSPETQGAPTKEDVTFAIEGSSSDRRVTELVLGDGR